MAAPTRESAPKLELGLSTSVGRGRPRSVVLFRAGFRALPLAVFVESLLERLEYTRSFPGFVRLIIRLRNTIIISLNPLWRFKLLPQFFFKTTFKCTHYL